MIQIYQKYKELKHLSQNSNKKKKRRKKTKQKKGMSLWIKIPLFTFIGFIVLIIIAMFIPNKKNVNNIHKNNIKKAKVYYPAAKAKMQKFQTQKNISGVIKILNNSQEKTNVQKQSISNKVIVRKKDNNLSKLNQKKNVNISIKTFSEKEKKIIKKPQYICENTGKIPLSFIYFVKTGNKIVPAYTLNNWNGRGVVLNPYEIKKVLKIKIFNKIKYYKIEKNKYFINGESEFLKCFKKDLNENR